MFSGECGHVGTDAESEQNGAVETEADARSQSFAHTAIAPALSQPTSFCFY